MEQAGEGPPVIALHGVGGGAYFFRGLAERLGLRYQVTATDLPLSAAGGPVSMAGWALDVIEIVRERLGGPVVLVGHSLGTILALEIWRRAPELVRAMAFVGGLPEVRDAVRPRLRDRMAAVAEHGMGGWGARISPGIFGGRAFDEKPEVVGLFERLLEAHDPGAYVTSLGILLSASAVDVVPAVTVPCVSISGSADAYAPPEDVAAFIARLPNGCPRIVLDGVGHMPFFEAPDAFARAVGEFLDGLPGRSR